MLLAAGQMFEIVFRRADVVGFEYTWAIRWTYGYLSVFEDADENVYVCDMAVFRWVQ